MSGVHHEGMLESRGGILGKGNSSEKISPAQQAELDKLLQCYEEVFQEKQGLPPGRGREHSIVIQDGQGPVNVCPYRYPHHQKNEIERQVREMLASGIIR